MIVYESLKMTQGKLCIKEENSLAKKKKKKMKHGRTIQFGLIQQAFFEAS